MNLKQRVKAWVKHRPALWSIYWSSKQQLLRLLMLRYFLYDIRHSYSAMYWVHERRSFRSLSAELLFWYHKLEKGLVMPGPKRLFGLEPAEEVLARLYRWRGSGHDPHHPVYLGAIQTIVAYRDHLERNSLDVEDQILSQVRRFLEEETARDEALTTPQTLPRPAGEESGLALEAFQSLSLARRSVRDFTSKVVPHSILDEALRLARLSPSACNRQPWHVYFYREPSRVKQLLSHQNGNRGFGHLVPVVAMVTVDESCFFDATERHQPYVDGGLFSMSFLLALRAQGIASCCLNWCVRPKTDAAVHRYFKIPVHQRIIMLIAIGYAPDEAQVPQSPRRAVSEIASEGL